MNSTYPYIASLTREPFLFYEMRTTAKLLTSGLSAEDAVAQITVENLFQYPTEKSIARMAKACVKRLQVMKDADLIHAIATQPTEIAKQICLYALMKQSRLVWEFMLTVIGEKYRSKDISFGRIDLNTYFIRLQEQDDTVASWSEGTITKLKQVLAKILVETEYLDDVRADHLNPVYLHPILENAIRSHGDLAVLPAFNCFS
jgi:putative inner membrane protein